MTDDSLLGQLAEEFTHRVREGKPPDVEEFAQRYPQLAGRIRELFPTLMLLEGLAAGNPAAGELRPSPLSAGSVFGNYRIEREIGRGGMGIVYEAVHVLLEKRVALKVLPIETLAGPERLERFFREARTAAGLHHTNIVPVFDVGQVAGTPYYAMQYIEGRGLNEFLQDLQPDKRKSPAPGSDDYFRWVAGIGIQAAAGLAYAHERKVVHRDIKPSNLLLDSEGVVWIADFGLARKIEDPAMTQSGTLVGTPRYMSPEQAQGATRPVDHRSDIYSLGATLYELLTSRPVFEGKTPLDVISQILTREPVALRQLNPEIPADLATIVMKAMAKAPEDRYQSVQELADDLHRWLKLEPIHARSIGPIGRMVRWRRRNPKLAAVSATAVLTVLILSGIYYASLVKENADTRAALKREQEARAAADLNGYAANLTAAEMYLRADSIADAEQRLSVCSPSLRGWEWQHLKLRANPALATIQLNSIPTQMTLSADGSKVLWLSAEENEIWAADIRSHKLVPLTRDTVKKGTGTTGPPYLIAFSRDGKRIARTLWKPSRFTFSRQDNAPRAWFQAIDNVGSREVNPLRNILEIAGDLHGAADSSTKFSNAGFWIGEDSVFGPWAGPSALNMGARRSVISVVFSADGTRFAAWTWDGNVRICDAESGKILCSLPGGSSYIAAVALSPAGDLVAAASIDGSVHLWRVPSGIPIAVLRGHPDITPCLAFRPDGKQIASGSGNVQLWDPSSGKLIRTFERIGATSLAFSADGKRIVASGENGFHVMETDSGKELVSLPVAATSAIFDASGTQIIAGSGSAISFWDANSLTYLSTLEIPKGAVASAIWNPDSRHIAVNVSAWKSNRQWAGLDTPDSQSVLIWDALTEETTPIISWPIRAIGENTFSPDAGKIAAAFDSEIQLLNLSPGSKPLILTDQKGSIDCVAFAPDGKTIASADINRVIALWDPLSGKLLRTMTGHEDWNTRWLEFSPDGSRLLSVNSDKTMRIWDVATGKPLVIFRDHKNYANKAVFNPDNRLVLSSSNESGRVWDSLTGKEHFSFSCAGADAIFDREGNRVYAGCSDGTLGVWDVKTGMLLRSSKSQTGSFRSLAFSPDGSRLIAGVGGSIKIWDAASLTPLLTMPAHVWVESVAFSPDGSMILSVGNDGKAKIWKSKRQD